MSRRLVFRKEAQNEIRAATQWYKERATGLEAEFVGSLEAAVASAHRTRFHYQVVHKELRRVLLRRFPYSLIFRASDEEVIVVACAHWRQKPKRWMNRR